MKLKEIKDIDKYKLCYVERNFAYFTRLPLDEQGGDDWNDAPYEYNAGTPYDEENIVVLAFFSDTLADPPFGHCNSPYSVEAINHGAVAWLSDRCKINIQAGCGIEEFISKTAAAGGKVFSEVEL